MKDGRKKGGITRRRVLFAVAAATPALALMAGMADAKIQQAWQSNIKLSQKTESNVRIVISS